MDTSEQYIKMCEKAEEVQKLWIRARFDFIWLENEKRLDVLIDLEYGDGCTKFIPLITTAGNENPAYIWLPRQDQLQGMIEETLPGLLIRFSRSWIGKIVLEFNDYFNKLSSMEQLWLAFVMKELYGKTWNGEDWSNG